MSKLGQVKNWFPRTYRMGPPVMQLYLHDKEIDTRYAVQHFSSFYCERGTYELIFRVRLYSAMGKEVAQKDFTLSYLQSQEIVPSECFDKVPEIGMCTIELKTKEFQLYPDRHLGILKPFFYALYHTRDFSSMGLVHPQSAVFIKETPKIPWLSAQFMETGGLSKIVSYHLNPTVREFKTGIYLQGQNNKLQSREITLSAMGVSKEEWNIKECGERLLRIGCDSLSTPNAKPLLFLYFEDGSFSMSHA